MLRTLLLSTLFFIISDVSAQQFRDYVRAGDKAYEQKNFYEALTRYGDAMEMYDGSTEINYRYAESARMFDAYKVAEKAYETVIFSEEAKEYPMAKFWLGTIKKQLGNYTEAREMFTQFLSSSPSDNLKILEARKHVKDCEWAIPVEENLDKSKIIKQLNQEVNTPYSDFGAIARGDTLYYSSDRFENEDDDFETNRHISKVLTSVAGTKGMPLKNGFNKKRSHTAHTAFNKAGNKMYYTVCEYISTIDIRCELFVRKRKSKGNWNPGEKLPEAINLPQYTHTQPSVGFDKKSGKEILYFASNREGGKGGMDIWNVQINADGTYGQASNLMSINTEEDDITPFFDNATQTLFFSSKGYPTLGGFDIYKSQKTDDAWQVAQHLGAPINSSFNDIYYSQSTDGTDAYFSSNRMGSAYIEQNKEACCNDIYKVELGKIFIDLTAFTLEGSNESALKGVELILQNKNGQKLDTQYNPNDNEFLFQLEPNQSYSLVANKEGYAPVSKKITVGDGSDRKSYEEHLVLAKLPTEKPKPLALEAMVFDKMTKSKIKGATVLLINEASQQKKDKYNPANNNFNFDLERETPYLLIAKKEGYMTDSLYIEPSALLAASDLTKELYLEKRKKTSPPPVSKYTLDGYLPLPLYFDNDQPDSNTRRTSTQKTYIQSYDAYYARKSTYKNEYAKGLLGEQKLVAETEIENFFDLKVKAGRNGLESFSIQLLRFLQQGESVEIKVRGFASPRAKSDYNKSLTNRRVSSIRNHFQSWNGGALVQYINNQQLKITEVAFGEDSASQGVSDNINDRKNSIYSVSASQERRVEIMEIKSK